MQERADTYLMKLNSANRIRENVRQMILLLSLLVILVVFWSLKLTGITLAGEAFCGKEEHVHSEDCLAPTVICTQEEAPPHSHSVDCRETILHCTLTGQEAHQHTEACYSQNVICELQESEAHSHSENCYEQLLICVSADAETHTHDDLCYTETENYTCGLEETEGHAHTQDCYNTPDVCLLEEHIHEESCYSDITADLETSDDWEMTLAGLVRSPSTAKNAVAVAQSQLGYTESTRNFEVDEFGIRRGISRYGQWYGNPYGDWSAMFVSFCLHYAGAEDLPANAGPEAMRLEWEAAGLYQTSEAYSPQPGNLIFLQKDTGSEAETANAVAIITDFDGEMITVIEGDLDNSVSETTYSVEDPGVIGYGLVPNQSEVTVLAVTPPEGTEAIARTTSYDESLFNGTSCFVVYTTSGDNYYAFDGTGNAVLIYIDDSGNILTDVEDPNTLLWTFSGSNGTYTIQNVSSGRYMHAYPNNGSGVTTAGAYSSTLIASGSGVKIRSNTEYARLNAAAGQFVMTQNSGSAAVYQFGVTERCTVWLDGTDGGMGHLTGSPNTAYSTQVGATIRLPETWTSPSKYNYKLRGWYDVTNSRYYPAGAEMEVTGNAVLYADWVASTYDIGVFNAQVADTVSTNAFITIHMFDYNYLFNVHSANPQVTVTASSHSESWSMVTSGNVNHRNQQTYDFIFIDNDSNNLLCMPGNRSSHNVYPGAGIVTPDIYTAEIGELLFATDNVYDPATGTGVIGKTYLGTGDHLFQIMDDPSDEHYGYYYYDSKHNAASYNQSQRRFYVYDYLAATSDSIGSTYSDFIPLNSPYANTNGKNVGTYNYAGVDGEYDGVPHFRYDSKYNSGNYNSADNVQTDYAYGMRTDINFYLPNEPGTGGNKDLYGNDLEFSFSGDDDLWVLIDGVLVLDIGGIHGAEDGVIDFSTGMVTVQGNQQTSLMDLGVGAGDHTLSVLYLERGSSMSNCSIYFNLAPRFSLQLQKEDVLTQQLLDGAQFTVYEDLACTQPVELWESESAYSQDLLDGILDQAQSTFTVANGVVRFWGLGAGNTYYIKETGPPDAEGYGLAQGVIRLKIEKAGVATYQVDVIADADGNEPSRGFTVHGVNIDEETKTVYLVVTNAPETVTDVTTVQVYKKWEDDADHSSDYITAYLTVTDPDGTIRRIREILLSDENGWEYTWTNLPKYDYDTLLEVKYGIEESYESGYYSTVRRITELTIETSTWAEAYVFADGETYLLKTASGCLAATSASASTLTWMDEETAKTSSLALWRADVGSDGKVKFTNGAGQILTFNYSSSSSSRYFYATTGSASYQTFTPVDTSSGFRLYATRSNRSYYLYSLNTSNGRISATTTASRGMTFTPMKKITETDVQEIEDWAYQITNTPLDAANETSLTVQKNWDIRTASASEAYYQEAQVTVKLLANGVETGRTVTLSLKNGWVDTFLGLPYRDAEGNVISYTVLESWETDDWVVTYGAVVATDGDPPTYFTTITNTYRWGGGVELPSTGSAARMMYILCGWAIMLGSLVYGNGSRRKRERRME